MKKFKGQLATIILGETLKKTDEIKSLLLSVSFNDKTEITILGNDEEITASIANHIVQVKNEAELVLWDKIANTIKLCLNNKELVIGALINKGENIC